MATCYTPDPGVACALDLNTTELHRLLPPGSGTCGCGLGSDRAPNVAGPFAPNPADDSARSEGSCCYVIGRIGCTGRPLIVQGALQLAPLTERADWGSPVAPNRPEPGSVECLA